MQLEEVADPSPNSPYAALEIRIGMEQETKGYSGTLAGAIHFLQCLQAWYDNHRG